MKPTEAQRQRNLAKFYDDRQQAARDDREITLVVLDRARAVAKERARSGDPNAWRSLAQHIVAWINQHGG